MVGPLPMHCLETTTNVFTYDPAQFDLNLEFATASMDKPAETNSSTPAIVASTSTNAAAPEFVAPKPEPVVLEAKSVGNIPSNGDPMAGIGPVSVFPVFNSSGPRSSASDLLVSPQMVTPYLKPNQIGNNALDQPGAGVFMPAGVQFEPPAPQNAPESRAVYRSQ